MGGSQPYRYLTRTRGAPLVALSSAKTSKSHSSQRESASATPGCAAILDSHGTGSTGASIMCRVWGVGWRVARVCTPLYPALHVVCA